MTIGFDNLKAALISPDEEVRRSAVASLRETVEPWALPLVENALGDDNWRVRKAAVEVIREHPDRETAAGVFIKALGDEENAGRRTAAMEGLAAMAQDAVPYLLANVNHPDLDVRKFIVDILGDIGDPAAVDSLAPLVRHSSDNIRLAAVEALGAIGGDKAFDLILDLLPTGDLSLQFSLLHSLGKIGKPIPVDGLRPLLDKKILRRAIYDALGRTRSKEAVELIVDGIRESTKSARQAAVRSLYILAREPGLGDFVEQKVKDALADENIDYFGEFIDADNREYKLAAIKLLSMIGSPSALDILLKFSSDDSVQADVDDAISRINKIAPSVVDKVEKEKKPVLGKEFFKSIRDPRPPPKVLGPMSMAHFEKVRDLVTRVSGLHYEHDLKYLLERRVQRRMEDVGLDSYEEYVRLVEGRDERGQTERRRLINSLSTNETYFFREDFQLRAFHQEILPALMEQKRKSRDDRIRVWSAGCSSGEEPYTIAILIQETPGTEHFKFDVVGSDINDQIVAQARKAEYGLSSFRATTDYYKSTYFVQENNRFRLIDQIRKMVSFDTTNILEAKDNPRLKNIDVIFCRNVIIYFNQEAKKQVVDQFYQLLNPGGYLLLGHSESLMSISTQFELVHLKNDLVYRKPIRRRGRE